MFKSAILEEALVLTKASWDLTRSVAMDIKDGAKTRTVPTVNQFSMTPSAGWNPKELAKRDTMMSALAGDHWELDLLNSKRRISRPP